MNNVQKFLDKTENMINEFPFLYVEIARTRSTEWMAWACTHNKDTHPEREVLANGQADTADGACAVALHKLEVLGY